MNLDCEDLAQSALGEDNFGRLVTLCRQSMHQLNNRLTTVLANTQLTLLMLKDENLRRYLKSVEDAAREAGMIVKSLQEATQTFSKGFSNTDILKEEALTQK